MELFKITGPNGECLNGGSGRWSLPTATKPGDWWTLDEDAIVACRYGLHLASAEQIKQWLPRDGSPYVVHRVETDGPVIDAGAKWVAASVRLLPRRAPMPDLAAAAERLRKAETRAAKPRQRARTAADTALTAAVPAIEYLRLIGDVKLPAGHPLAAALAGVNEARATHRAANVAADAAYARAIAPAQRAYARALAAIVDGA